MQFRLWRAAAFVSSPIHLFQNVRMEFLHPAMWHMALELWQWIHQVTAPCNVIRGSGMTCHWIRPNVRNIGILHLVSISTHHRSRHAIEFAQTSAILEFYIWFPFPHITAVDMSFCTSLRNFIQIEPPSAEKNDVMSTFKMAYLSHLGL